MNTEILQASGFRNYAEAGFSLLLALVVVLFIAFAAAVLMNLLRIRYALLGIFAVVIIAALISALPDVRRYIKINSM